MYDVFSSMISNFSPTKRKPNQFGLQLYTYTTPTSKRRGENMEIKDK